MRTPVSKTFVNVKGNWIPAIIIVLLYIGLSIISFTTVNEDAYITFRYAENLANGFGLVFNEGGERIEGYSNPTWLFLISLAKLIRVNPVFAGRCLGLLFGALILIEIHLLFRSCANKNIHYGSLAALSVATAPAYLYWMQSGLENALYVYLIILTIRLVVDEALDLEDFQISWLPLLLLALTRPESILFIVVIGFWKIANVANNNTPKARFALIAWLDLLLIPFLIFLFWRHAAFGEWVPNTFFAKVNNGLRYSFITGFQYLISFLNHSLWIPLVLPLVAYTMHGFKIPDTRKDVVGLLLYFSIAYLIFALYTGGDIHPYDRFCVLFLVFSPILAFLILPDHPCTQWEEYAPTFLVAVFILGNLLYSYPPQWDTTPKVTRPPNAMTVNLIGLVYGNVSPGEILTRFKNPPVDVLEYVGRDLKNDPSVDGLLAVEQCGKIPYFYGGPVLDLLGLNDSRIAHIVHDVSTWDIYAEAVLNELPETFVFVYTDNHLISQYYLENTVMSEPFQLRYKLDRIYHADNYFKLLEGAEYSFPLELLVYRQKWDGDLNALTRDELNWLRQNEPIVDNPDGLSNQVEAFRRRHSGDSSKVIEIRVDYN